MLHHSPLGISIHALREEGDHLRDLIIAHCKIFLSTPSARRATADLESLHSEISISIHALREEGDARRAWPSLPPVLFLSTPSARRATSRWIHTGQLANNFYPRPPRGGRPGKAIRFQHRRAISIHALREEGDGRPLAAHSSCCRISIHALREEGDADVLQQLPCSLLFLSTASARRATELCRTG